MSPPKTNILTKIVSPAETPLYVRVNRYQKSPSGRSYLIPLRLVLMILLERNQVLLELLASKSFLNAYLGPRQPLATQIPLTSPRQILASSYCQHFYRQLSKVTPNLLVRQASLISVTR